MLAAYLTWLFFSEGIGSPRGTAGPYSGAAMLFENAGGYVTTAVAAFMAGVIIAAACIRYRQKQKRESGPDGIRQADSQGKASATKDSNGGEN